MIDWILHLWQTIAGAAASSQMWAWLLTGPLIVLGYVGTLLPVLPGTLILLGAFVLFGLITGFETLSWIFFLGQAVLVGLSYLFDFLATGIGVKMYGGSKAAVWGAVLGAFLVFVIGPVGLVAGPLAGAVAGELLMGERLPQAVKAGFGSFLGFLGGTLAKLCIATLMVAWFVFQVR